MLLHKVTAPCDFRSLREIEKSCEIVSLLMRFLTFFYQINRGKKSDDTVPLRISDVIYLKDFNY